MSVREALLALVLLLAAGLIVTGVARWSVEAAFILAGVFVGAIGALFLVEGD